MEPAAARRWSAAISMLMKWEIKKTTKTRNFISMAQKSSRTSVCGVSPLYVLFFCHAHTLIWLNSGDRKTCGTSRRDGIILFFAPAGDGDVDRKCQL